jgi:hypothetical protein
MLQGNEAFCLAAMKKSKRDYFVSCNPRYILADLRKPLLHVQWGKSSGDVISSILFVWTRDRQRNERGAEITKSSGTKSILPAVCITSAGEYKAFSPHVRLKQDGAMTEDKTVYCESATATWRLHGVPFRQHLTDGCKSSQLTETDH